MESASIEQAAQEAYENGFRNGEKQGKANGIAKGLEMAGWVLDIRAGRYIFNPKSVSVTLKHSKYCCQGESANIISGFPEHLKSCEGC